MTRETLEVARRYRGPNTSGNGGWTCGAIAQLLGGEAEVTLRLPPPLETPLRVERDGGAVRVFDGEGLVADAVAHHLELDAPGPIAFDEAEAASAAQPSDPEHPFPECFVCGPARAPGDGLRLNPAPVRDAVVAAPWVPAEAPTPELHWAALDCPGAFAVNPDGARGVSVLGRFAVRILDPVREGERCVVLGWPLGADGRKLHAGTALYGEDSRLSAVGRAIWIVLD